jgi:ubiquinone/menaquinone biosynthesis C-methylase UbiE
MTHDPPALRGTAGETPPRPLSRLLAAAYDLVTAGVEEQVWGAQRRRLLQAARGKVVEVGAGTGANLAHYRGDQVSELVLVDPSAGMLERARRRTKDLRLDAQVLRHRAERLPLEDESSDTVVFTLALCTIPDPGVALREAKRVLRPDGRLLVFEHIRAPEPSLARWQDRVTPVWKLLNGGCHPNRDTQATVEAAGFVFVSVHEWKERRMPLSIMQPTLLGEARPRP